MQNFFFLAKLCHLVTKKREKQAVQNIQRIFLKKMAQITHILRGGKTSPLVDDGATLSPTSQRKVS